MNFYFASDQRRVSWLVFDDMDFEIIHVFLFSWCHQDSHESDIILCIRIKSKNKNEKQKKNKEQE